MRYKELYEERDIEFIMEACRDKLNILKKECGPWFDAIHDLKYQGYHQSDTDYEFKKISITKERQPRDSTEGNHNFYNMLIHRAGLVANRSNSIFVLGRKAAGAAKYGEYTFSFFPVGEFNYTWNTDYYDLHDLLLARITKKGFPHSKEDFEIYDDLLNRGSTLMMKDPNYMHSQIEQEKFEKLLQSFRGDDGSLIDALKIEREIMIHPRNLQGYMVRYNVSEVIKYLHYGNEDDAYNYIDSKPDSVIWD